MGVIDKLFGTGLRAVGETVQTIGGVVRENPEKAAARAHDYNVAALEQYAAEFQDRAGRTWVDAVADALNRLARPLITISVLGMLPAVVIWPERMSMALASLALLPTAYWALLTTIIAFYYGGRMQIKANDLKRDIALTAAVAPKVIGNITRMREEIMTYDKTDIKEASHPNPAIADWRKRHP